MLNPDAECGCYKSIIRTLNTSVQHLSRHGRCSEGVETQPLLCSLPLSLVRREIAAIKADSDTPNNDPQLAITACSLAGWLATSMTTTTSASSQCALQPTWERRRVYERQGATPGREAGPGAVSRAQSLPAPPPSAHRSSKHS